MDEPRANTGQMKQAEVEVIKPPDPRWHAFAMRLALGGSVSEAAARAGVSRTTGYEWFKDQEVQRLVSEYSQEAANRARRELAGLVRKAVRTVGKLMGEAATKGSPTQLEAAKLVLNWNRIDVIPVAATERRILTYVPRGDREAPLPPLPEDSLDARALDAPVDLPVTPTPDGLPPDFPRHPDGSVDLGQVRYYGPGYDPAKLTDPDFWTQAPERRTMRHYGDGRGRADHE